MFQNVGAFVSFQGFLNNDHKLIEGQCNAGKDCELKACTTQTNCKTHSSDCLTTSNIGNVNKKKCNAANSGYRVVPANNQCIAKISGNNAKNCNTTACGDTTNCLKLFQGEVLPDCGTNKRLNVNSTPPSCVTCPANSFPVRDVKVSGLTNAQKVEAQEKGIDLSPGKNNSIFQNVNNLNAIITNRTDLLLYKKTGAEEYYVSYKNGTPLTGLYNRCFTCPTGYMKGSGNFCTEASCTVPTTTVLGTNNIEVPSGSTCQAGSTIVHGKTCSTTDLKCKNGYTTSIRKNCDKGTFTPPTCTENVCNFSGTNRNVSNGTIGTKVGGGQCPSGNNVPSGTLCSVTCNDASKYTLTPQTSPAFPPQTTDAQKNGIYCKKGRIYKPTCVEKKCNFSGINVTDGTIGTKDGGGQCPSGNNVPSGTLCNVTCNGASKYTLTPQTSQAFPTQTTDAQKRGIYCKMGQIYKPTCQGNPCTAPANTGNIIAPTTGDCKTGASVGHGITCNPQPTCKNTHTKSGTAKCSLGTFTNITCNPKTCKCDNGTKATDGNCISGQNANTCTACNSGYRLGPTPTTDKGPRNCLQNTCTCSNGTAASASAANQQYCNVHNQVNCVNCNTGYRLIMKGNDQNNQGQTTSNDDEKRNRTIAQCKTKTSINHCKCSLIKCSCPNGQGHTGSSCGDASKHNTTKCERCNSGYVLNGTPPSCISTSQCQCTNGSPLRTVSGDNQCPFSTNTQACSSCNTGYYKRRPDAMKDLDTIVAETTSANGGVVLSFLGSITSLDTGNIVSGSYTILVDSNDSKKLNIGIGSTKANSEKTFTFKSNNVQYTMKLPITNDTVMKQPLNNNANKTNNARVLRNFLEKEYPATCKAKACTGPDNGKWRDFDDGTCHVYCSLNSNFTQTTESGKKVYSNKIPSDKQNIYKFTTDATGLANRNKRYFPVTSTTQDPPMSSAPIINNADLIKNNYEITLRPDYWLKNPHDVNLKCGNQGKIDIVDGNGSSIITQCDNHPQCAQHKETTSTPKKKICGRYVTVKGTVTESQWNTSATTYSTATTANKSSAWNNVVSKIDKRLFQCSQAKPGYFLGAESTNNPFGTDQKYKYDGSSKKWIKQ